MTVGAPGALSIFGIPGLPEIMEGAMEELISALIGEDEASRLAELG